LPLNLRNLGQLPTGPRARWASNTFGSLAAEDWARRDRCPGLRFGFIPGYSTYGSKRTFAGGSSDALSRVAFRWSPVESTCWVSRYLYEQPCRERRTGPGSAPPEQVPGVPRASTSSTCRAQPVQNPGCDGRRVRAPKALLRRRSGKTHPRAAARALAGSRILKPRLLF
jgi:hypothetical protein